MRVRTPLIAHLSSHNEYMTFFRTWRRESNINLDYSSLFQGGSQNNALALSDSGRDDTPTQQLKRFQNMNPTVGKPTFFKCSARNQSTSN